VDILQGLVEEELKSILQFFDANLSHGISLAFLKTLHKTLIRDAGEALERGGGEVGKEVCHGTF